MTNKKTTSKKRVYVKKAAKWTKKGNENAIENIELVKPAVLSRKKDNELQELTEICSIFDNWTPEQKRRNLQFLCGRYYDFM